MGITMLAFFHIFIVNSLFIVIDYFVLKHFVKTRVSFLIVAIAGLTSLFLGVYVTTHLVEYFFHDQWFGFRNGVVKKSLFLTGVLMLTICNIIIEWPFYILATKNKKFGQSLKSVIISNFATNIPVGLLYFAGDAFYSVPE